MGGGVKKIFSIMTNDDKGNSILCLRVICSHVDDGAWSWCDTDRSDGRVEIHLPSALRKSTNQTCPRGHKMFGYDGHGHTRVSDVHMLSCSRLMVCPYDVDVDMTMC